MLTLKEDKILSKNKRIVYEIFNLNPFTTFSVNRLLEIINKDAQVMSKRTVFRAVKKLIETGKIYCSEMKNRTRSFELSKNNYCVMTCEICGEKNFVKISDNNIDQILMAYYDFSLKRLAIEVRGVCEKCC
ncbi:transcriptional repressor [Wukongibacter sp. M2B1]|uniref:transcriptional repressor n=1 Tax=Wukongibacter sp. M2B1 TaxID=3088895 RepID=UPI003D7BD3FB